MNIVKDLLENFYDYETKKINKPSAFASLVVLTLIICFVIFKEKKFKIDKTDRMNHLRYTVATTGKKNKNFRSSQPTVKYYYKYLNNDYKSLQHIDAKFENNIVINGGRYYVELSSKNPDNSKLRLDLPVPDSIIVVPDTGWIIPPGNVSK
jgi:hypothetical protein